MSSIEDNTLYNEAQEQNRTVFEEINPKFREAANYIITKYDWKNSPLDFPDEYLKDIDKFLEFSKIYIKKRGDFLKMITSYLK